MERIRSHYLHDLACGRERRPIDRAVQGNEHYLASSRYALQIEQYLEHFPREQLLLMKAESLRTDRPAAMRRILDFIGVDSDWSAPVQEREFNASDQKTTPNALLRAARHLPGGARLRLLAPRQVKAAEQLFGRSRNPVDRQAATMSEELTQAVIAGLRPDLVRLAAYLDDSYDAWGTAVAARRIPSELGGTTRVVLMLTTFDLCAGYMFPRRPSVSRIVRPRCWD